MDISVNNYYGSNTVTVSGIEAEFDLSDIIDECSDDVIIQQAKDRDLYVFESQDDMIDALVNDDQERDMLDKMDLGRIIDILGDDDLLSEMDDESIKNYAVENNLIDVANLDDFGTEALVDELMQRNDYDALLSAMDSEFIQAHMINKRGGFTLEATDTDLLIGELEARKGNSVFTVTEEVAKAVATLNEFTAYILASKGGLEGKRFLLPTE